MKQLSIFDNESRIDKVRERKDIRILIEMGIPKEYLCNSKKVCIVEKIREVLSGVGLTTYYKISFDGKIYKPLTSKGVKLFLKKKLIWL